MQVVLHSTYFHIFIIILVVLDALTVLCELLLDVGAFGKCMEGREGGERKGGEREGGERKGGGRNGKDSSKVRQLGQGQRDGDRDRDSERDRDRDRVSHLEDTTLLWLPW